VFNVNIEPANSIQAVVDTLTSNSNYTYNLYLRHYGNVVIHSENLILGGLECDVNFYAGSDSVITESDLNKIIIDGMGVSSTIFMNNCNNNMTFNGMTIRNGAGYYTMGSTYGGGIYIGPFHSSPTSIHINKCTIKDNHANRGAGICVESGTQVESLLELYINDSCIKNNGPSGSTISTTGGGIRIDSGNLYINNSSFLENYSGNGGGIYKSGVTSISEVTISNSIIHHNSAAYSASAIHFEGALNVVRRSELKLLNTTIANNECDTAYDGWNGVTVLCVRDVSHQNDLEMINSILWNNTSDSIVEPQIIIQGGSSYGTNTVNYNCVQLGCPAGSNNLTDNTDPLLVDEDNYDYNLKWTSSEKSPCIMAGYDQFGSDHYDRTDMGAIQYEANPHEYYTYRFPPHSERHGIKWMSFPTADRILSSPDQDMAFTMFDPIMQIPPPVTGIQWKPNNSYIQNLYYYNNQWYGNNHSVIPEQGYKFTSDENLSTPVHLYIKGLVYPDDTATSIVALLNGLPNEKVVSQKLV